MVAAKKVGTVKKMNSEEGGDSMKVMTVKKVVTTKKVMTVKKL